MQFFALNRPLFGLGLVACMVGSEFGELRAAQNNDAVVAERELAGLISDTAPTDTALEPAMPENYWTHPDTSPLSGVGHGVPAASHPYPYPLGPVSIPGLIAWTD